MYKLLVVCGPTASGKTQIALNLAKKFNGELISADSRQVYKGMDIGTGKDLPNQLAIGSEQIPAQCKTKNFHLKSYIVEGIPVWMVDIVNPDEEFSVSCYEKLARAVVEDVLQRGKLPIIVGGTGLYISALLSPIETSHIPPDKRIRKKLEAYSLEKLQDTLQIIDSPTWEKMNQSDRQNSRRLIRKIEIAEFNKNSKTVRVDTSKTLEHQDALSIGLTASYKVLYERIDTRVDKRVKQGIILEIKSLLKKGYSWELPSMNTFGYKEWKSFFAHNVQPDAHTLEPFIQLWKWDEHGYARRQMTWFKKLKDIQWFDISQKDLLEKVETAVHQWYTK